MSWIRSPVGVRAWWRMLMLMLAGGRIPKGSPVLIPILAMNRSKELWGEDSFEFK